MQKQIVELTPNMALTLFAVLAMDREEATKYGFWDSNDIRTTLRIKFEDGVMMKLYLRYRTNTLTRAVAELYVRGRRVASESRRFWHENLTDWELEYEGETYAICIEVLTATPGAWDWDKDIVNTVLRDHNFIFHASENEHGIYTDSRTAARALNQLSIKKCGDERHLFFPTLTVANDELRKRYKMPKKYVRCWLLEPAVIV
jgi:hypothetical protein